MSRLDRVEVYVDDTAEPVQVLTAPPFDFRLDTAALPDGEHTLRVVAHFTDGRRRERCVGIIVHNRHDPVPDIVVHGLEDGARVSGIVHAAVVAGRPEQVRRQPAVSALTPIIVAAVFLGMWGLFALAPWRIPPTRTASTAPGQSPPAAPPPGAASPAGAGSLKAGAQQFQIQGCSGCHMIAGVGGTAGPDLTHIGGRLSRAQLEATILHGEDGMPAFNTMSRADLNALLDYLQSLK
jgi:cytochrome c oxidase subunit 2